MTEEAQLVAEFAATRSDAAFAALVRLHSGMVFATAYRQLGDRGLAEEVTQSVFMALARSVPTLRGQSTLGGWLYKTTLNQARHCLRGELRRHKRERKAGELFSMDQQVDLPQPAILPLLDEALLALREADRLAVMLHYMEGRPFREIASVLGIGEDAVRKRVHRALEVLSGWFERHGFTVTRTTLVSALSLEGILAPALSAPALLAAAAGASASSVVGGYTLPLLLMSFAKSKILVPAVLLTFLAGAPFVWRHFSPSTPSQPAVQPLPPDAETAASMTNPPEVLPQTQIASAAANPLPRPPSVFERINNGDESLSYLSRELAEAFLARNNTNAESLLAAFKVTQHIGYLRAAATNFPSDPAVLLRVAAHDAFPENRRAWLDQFAAVDPDNALPWYLSARDHLNNHDIESAVRDLDRAAGKPFRDYVTEQIIALENIYLDAGRSPAEAKMLGMAAVELPHLSQLVETSNQLAALARQSQQAGDAIAAGALSGHGVAIARNLNTIQEGGNLLGQIVAVVAERRILTELDPSRDYPWLAEPLPERIATLNDLEFSIRDSSQFFSRWVSQATEAEVIHYFDRLEFYGEEAALDWLRGRHPGL